MKEIVLIAIALVGIYAFAPKLWSEGEILLRNQLSWTEEAKQKDPVGYLKYARRRLEINIAKMEEIAEKLERRIRRLEQRTRKTTKNVGQYQTLLARGRTLYASAQKSSRYPVEFVGARYTNDELVTQLRILYDRSTQAKEEITDMRRAYESTKKWYGEMKKKRAEAVNELTNLRTIITIAEAYESAREVEQTIRHIGTVTEEFDAYIGDIEGGKVPLRDADELLRREYRGASEEEFQKFLRGV